MAATGLFCYYHVIIILLSCYCTFTVSQVPFSPRPRQDPVKMPLSKVAQVHWETGLETKTSLQYCNTTCVNLTGTQVGCLQCSRLNIRSNLQRNIKNIPAVTDILLVLQIQWRHSPGARGRPPSGLRGSLAAATVL